MVTEVDQEITHTADCHQITDSADSLTAYNDHDFDKGRPETLIIFVKRAPTFHLRPQRLENTASRPICAVKQVVA